METADQNIYFPPYVSKTALFFYLLIQIVLIVLYPTSFIGFQWFAFGIFAMVFFFYYAVKLPSKWAQLSEKVFLKKVFGFALLIRFIYVLFSYFYYHYMTGSPFEFNTADALGYHNEALWVLEEIKIGRFNNYLFSHIPMKGLSDSGWSLFLIPIYLIFGNTVLIPRIANALLGSWMVLLVYRLARRNFGEGVARLSAILVALAPSLIYYTGLHLKETLMVFLVVAYLNQADLLIRSKDEIWKTVIKVVLLGISLFLFRTVIGLSAFFALAFTLLFAHKTFEIKRKKFAIIFFIAVVSLFGIAQYFGDEINIYYEQSSSNQDSQMENYASRQGGNTLAKYGNGSLFVPVIVIAPFPTMVDVDQVNSQMINGAVFTKNALAFFVLLTFWMLWRKKRLRFHLLLLLFLAAYLGILSLSGFALSERFHLPVLPILLIFVARGIELFKSTGLKKYYYLYMFAILILIVGWNWFKLSGRGLT